VDLHDGVRWMELIQHHVCWWAVVLAVLDILIMLL